jgi:hypothetical protein
VLINGGKVAIGNSLSACPNIIIKTSAPSEVTSCNALREVLFSNLGGDTGYPVAFLRPFRQIPG